MPFSSFSPILDMFFVFCLLLAYHFHKETGVDISKQNMIVIEVKSICAASCCSELFRNLVLLGAMDIGSLRVYYVVGLGSSWKK